MQLRRSVLTALGLAVAITGWAAAPARADDDHWRGRGWHEWHRPGVVFYGGPRYVYGPPPVVYEPPPQVVYAPPPVVYAPAPAPLLNVVVPLRFR